jgi:hypothetical protein
MHCSSAFCFSRLETVGVRHPARSIKGFRMFRVCSPSKNFLLLAAYVVFGPWVYFFFFLFGCIFTIYSLCGVLSKCVSGWREWGVHPPMKLLSVL